MGSVPSSSGERLKPVVLPGGKLIKVGDNFVDRQMIAAIMQTNSGALAIELHSVIFLAGFGWLNNIRTHPMTKEEQIEFFKAYSGAGSDDDWEKVASAFLIPAEEDETNEV